MTEPKPDPTLKELLHFATDAYPLLPPIIDPLNFNVSTRTAGFLLLYARTGDVYQAAQISGISRNSARSCLSRAKKRIGVKKWWKALEESGYLVHLHSGGLTDGERSVLLRRIAEIAVNDGSPNALKVALEAVRLSADIVQPVQGDKPQPASHAIYQLFAPSHQPVTLDVGAMGAKVIEGVVSGEGKGTGEVVKGGADPIEKGGGPEFLSPHISKSPSYSPSLGIEGILG